MIFRIKIFLILTVICILNSILAQGITLENGITFSLGGATISLTGNWDNSGTFNAEDGKVVFNGASGNQTIKNSNGELFDFIEINKLADNVVLLNNIRIDNALNLTSGDLDINGYIINLNATASVNETNGNTVIGNGSIQGSLNLNAPTGLNVFGTGFEVTCPDNMGVTQILRGHASQNGNGQNGILKYFDIEPANPINSGASIVFHYDESELNGINEADLRFLKSEDGGQTWVNLGGTVNAVANTVSISGINSFSKWTISKNAPPVLSNIETTSLDFKENQASTKISNLIQLKDLDNPSIISAKIELAGIYREAYDILEFVDFSNISGTFNTTTGILSLSGIDLVENYQTAIRSVKYKNISDNPETGSRSIKITVTDNDENSNTLTRIINLESINDPPIEIANTGIMVVEGGKKVISIRDLYYDDPDNIGNLEYIITELPKFGSLNIDSSKFTHNTLATYNLVYTHFGEENDKDYFKFYVKDDNDAVSEPSVFNIGIIANNDPPVFVNKQDTIKIDNVSECSCNLDDLIYDPDNPDSTLTINVISLNDSVLVNVLGTTLFFEVLNGFYGECLMEIQVADPSGACCYSSMVVIVEDKTTTVSEKNGLPRDYNLSQNYPNPFNPSTVINYALPELSYVEINIYNISGELVEILYCGEQNAGFYNLPWNAGKLSSGIYFYRMIATSEGRKSYFIDTKKMILVK